MKMCTALRCRGIYAAPLINNVLIEVLISMAILSQKCGLRLVMVQSSLAISTHYLYLLTQDFFLLLR